MKKDDIYDGVTDVGDDHVTDTKKRKKRGLLIGLAAAILIAAGAGGYAWWRAHCEVPPEVFGDARTLRKAVYPERVKYPKEGVFGVDEDQWDKWREETRRRQLTSEELDAMADPYAALLPALIGAAGEEDMACSPANVYIALSMLAETTAGNSQKQILDLLGTESAAAQRQLTKRLWNALYNDDGTYQSLLANSVWLRDDTDYEQDALRILAEDYYASSFSGKMGGDRLNAALRDWMDRQTGGLLTDQINGISLEPETALALVSTAYFSDKWEMEFYPEFTDRMTFHGESGDYERDFMHKTYSGTYFWSDKFAGVVLGFESGGAMRFLLPDEGVSIEEALADPMAVAFLTEGDLWDTFEGSCRTMEITLSLPKFDVTSDLKLIDALKSLGVTDVFDPNLADFSPVLKNSRLMGNPLYVSQALHGARVKVDEEGCEAAAYTLIAMAGSAGPSEDAESIEVDLDRPFLYSLMSGGVPLFAGAVRE